MKKYILGVVIILVVGFGMVLAFQKKSSTPAQKQNEQKIDVVVTFYPLEYIATQVGGDLVNVSMLTPAGGEPHDYDPTAQDIIKIRTSDLFVMNGADFEPWAEKLLPELEKEKVHFIEMSEHVELLKATEHGDEHTEEGEATEEVGHHHEMGEFDPHFWLSPTRLQQEVKILATTLSEIDPQNASTYQKNAEVLLNKIVSIENEYKKGLANCTKKEVVTSHNAFSYLASDYNFEVHGIAGLSVSEEPSAQHLAELTQLVKDEGIEYIFTETLVSPKFANTLAKETGVMVAILNPLEGLNEQEKKEGKNLETILFENLKNLQKGLDCRG